MKNEEWLKGDEKELEYHLKQYETPKLYTIELFNYIKEWNLIKENDNVLDIGCGCGAVVNYFSNNFKNTNFYGIDLNEEYINIANDKKCINTNFYKQDISKKFKSDIIYNGIICLQTLSWLKVNDYKKIIKNVLKIKPDWFLITSLFYDGPVDTKIQIKDYSRITNNKKYRKSYYNIYSISKLDELLKDRYYIEKYIPFEIDIDLKKNDKGMGTYTEKLDSGKRIQISGPLLMPWYTILIKKK